MSGIGDIRKIALKIPTTKIDRKGQYTSLMPNIIHSLDAANVVRAYERFTKGDGRDFFSIHDCFASQAGNMQYLHHCVKQAFVSIYIKKEFINNFHNSCLNNLALHDPAVISVKCDENVVINMMTNKQFDIPTKPAMGELDINAVMNSEYMVH